jgi:regulator of replication initiation timing
VEQITFFLALIAGFLFGASIVWLIQRNDVRQAYARARTEFNAEIAGLSERVKSREEQVSELRAESDERERRVATMLEENSTLKAVNADLQAKLAVGAESHTQPAAQTEATLAALQEHQQKLAQTFHALTVKALRSSQETFLELAKSKLDAVRASDAVVTIPAPAPDWKALLDPLQESLQRVDARIHDLAQVRSAVPAPPAEWEHLLQPLQESLQRVDSHLQGMDAAHTPAPAWQELLHPLFESLQRVDGRLQEIENAQSTRKRDLEFLSVDLRIAQEAGFAVFQQLQVFGERFAGIGRNLELAMECHSTAAITLEASVMAAARRFENIAGTLNHAGTETLRALPEPAQTQNLAELAEAIAEPERAVVEAEAVHSETVKSE